MPATDILDKANPGPFGSTVTNFAAVQKSGDAAADAAGDKDFTAPKAGQVSGSTMFGEGSIGKVRFAGLAYMLQQEGTIDLQKNAGEFFASPQVGKFLERKYPGKGAELQDEIGVLFSGEATQATIADLTTHRSGVGDLTRDQARLAEVRGVEHQFSIPELLSIPESSRVIPRDEGGRPRAQGPAHISDQDLPEAKHGTHQYSNLGYMLLALAMEVAYDAAKTPDSKQKPKDYKQLTRDYILHPTEGPAFEAAAAAGKKALSFDHTKFPEDPGFEKDGVARSSWLDKGSLVDATKYSGANAAGGMFASADDSVKFFNEFFKGFPGTPTEGIKGVNPFFSDDTIDIMMAEALKFPSPSCGRNNGKKDPSREGNEHFQAPGFVYEVGKDGKMLAFEKSGGTFGYASFLGFDPKSGQTTIDMCAQENVTGEIAKKRGATVDSIVVAYKESGQLDRMAMIAAEMPEILSTRAASLPTSETSGPDAHASSWVARVEKQSGVEKPRSFAEAATAGKYGNIGSKGGAREL